MRGAVDGASPDQQVSHIDVRQREGRGGGVSALVMFLLVVAPTLTMSG